NDPAVVDDGNQAAVPARAAAAADRSQSGGLATRAAAAANRLGDYAAAVGSGSRNVTLRLEGDGNIAAMIAGSSGAADRVESGRAASGATAAADRLGKN